MPGFNGPVTAAAAAVPEGFRGLQLLAVTDGIETWHVERVRQREQFLLRQPAARCSRQIVHHAVDELQRELHLTRMASSPYVRRAIHAELNLPRCYLLSDWLEGHTLESRCARDTALDLRTALWTARQCATGLADLQAAGFEHRSISASQVWLTPEGRALWFDLRHIVDRTMPAEIADPRACSSDTNSLVYLPPEALVGESKRQLSEGIYSLGVLFYRIFTGRLPFAATTREALIRLVRSATVPSINAHNSEVPAGLDRMIRSMMSKQPLRRPTRFADIVATLIPFELDTINAAV